MMNFRIKKQKGVALITSLIFLVLLTLIVTAALRSTLFEELMARGTGAHLNAFQAAEAVLRQAEADIFLDASSLLVNKDFKKDIFKKVTETPNKGFYRQTDGIWEAVDLSSTDDEKTKAPKYLSLPGTSSLRYVVECMGNCNARDPSGACMGVTFRLTTRVAGTDSSAVFMQENYRFTPTECSLSF